MDSVQSTISEAERSQLLLDAITDYAIYMLSVDGIVTTWNAGAARFMGYYSQEIIGQHFSQFYTPEDQAAGAPQRALRTAADEGRFEIEGWRVRKDGIRFWANVVIDRIRAGDGSLMGFAKITRDLTERRDAESALLESQEQFKRLVEGVTDYAIYMLSPAGNVTNWNTGAERIKGYTRKEIVGRHFSQFYTPEDREAGEPQRALDTALREGHFEKEAWRIRKDGTRFLAHVVIDPIRSSDGSLLGFAKITRDITERVAQQKSLDDTREQLYQSQKLEAVGQLTGGIAHDFNNLLMAVLSSLELAQKRLPTNDLQLVRLIDNAAAAAKRGATLTSRLLAFARRQELRIEPTDLVQLVHGMSDLLARSIGPNILIETRFPVGLPRVNTDPAQLESAILNLAVNARDAMPEGGKIIVEASDAHLDKEGDRATGDHLRLSMTDTGIGMDGETLAKAAEPFFTTKGVGKGTGLGLSMVHGLVQQSGGRLSIDSEVGVGTTVTIWLPKAPATEVIEQPRDRVPSTAESKAVKELTILAVDDDALILMNTRSMLEDMGHTVLDATSGAEAVKLLEDNKIDLVITDHAMPKMTGSQLADIIKTRWSSIPIILATGYAEVSGETARNLLRLPKPYSQADLQLAVDKWARQT